MTPTTGTSLDARLPLPIAALVRYSRNAKAAKYRHDAALKAWEVSIHLAVAARPPSDPSPLARGTLGKWCAALSFPNGTPEALEAPEILAAQALFAEFGFDRKIAPAKVAPRALIDAHVAYRNNDSTGHGGIRTAEHYDRASGVLLEGLIATWNGGLFLPKDAHLVYVESLWLDAAGDRRARLYDLAGHVSQVIDPTGTRGVPSDLLPGRVYLLEKGLYRSLHPLVLYFEQEQRERVLFFQRLSRKADFLDYVGGENLKDGDRRSLFPRLDEDVRAFFGGPGSRPGDESDAAETAGANRFGDYEILGKLGEGGMGVVYLARQIPLRRIVALKMLPAELSRDPVRVARFRQEITALGRCDHPNVVKIFASGETNGTPYFAMEFVDGPNLKTVAAALTSAHDFHTAVSSASDAVEKERAALFADVPDVSRKAPAAGPVASARPKDRYRQLALAFRDAARGVHELHEEGIVHRDLKPENLMITAAEHRVVVMDLGLAKVRDASVSITQDRHAILGTLQYIPPEQLLRSRYQVDRRADIYSLGATLYELIADRPLFDGDSEERLLQQIVCERPVPLRRAAAGVPRDLATIVEKAIEKEPRARYASAAEFADDLQAFLEGRPIAAREHGTFYPLYLWARQNRGWAATIAAAILALVAATIVVNDARILADENAIAAKKSQDKAELQTRLAEAASEEARLEKERVLPLADSLILRDLFSEADRLWPAVPEKAAAMVDWLARARRLLDEHPRHEARLEALRSRASSVEIAPPAAGRDESADEEGLERLRDDEKRSAALLASLDAERWSADDADATRAEIVEFGSRTRALLARAIEGNSRGRSWRFERFEDGWLHEILAKLVRETPRLSDPQRGWTEVTLAAMERRLEFGESVRRRSIDDERPTWDRAIAAIRTSAKYGGLVIRPQQGLVPIGEDAESRLWEFWHVQSGDKPMRDSSGRIRATPDMGIVLVLLPGGQFKMGSPDTEVHRETKEGPRTDVTLDPYFMSKFEMTQAQWLRATGRNPSSWQPGQSIGRQVIRFTNPVESVDRESARRVLLRFELDLPTEAQWEFAARAGTPWPWFTGERIDGGMARFANVADASTANRFQNRTESFDDGFVAPAPVDALSPSPFGLHHILGNVFEWVRDDYAPYSVRPESGTGERLGSDREHGVMRGGSYDWPGSHARAAYRYMISSGHRNGNLGVRPSRSVELGAKEDSGR